MPAARRTLTPTREPMATQRPRCVTLGRDSGGGSGPAEGGGGAAWVGSGVGGCACVGIGVGAAPGRGVSGWAMRGVWGEEAAAAGVFAAGAGVGDGAFPGTAVVRAGGSALPGMVFSAALRASADWKRFSGSLAMHIMMIWLSAGGRSLRRVIGGGGAEVSCAVISGC